jgi:hypothetical protein
MIQCRAIDVQPFAQKLLIFAGLLSLGVSAVYIWHNRNFKQLLAYSSASQPAGRLKAGERATVEMDFSVGSPETTNTSAPLDSPL